MTTEVTTPSTEFAPLPIRRRGTLEILDTALKLYRRYFWVLIGWSALVSVSSLIPIFGFFSYLLLAPFTFASVSCAVAAAVRGQKISFGQVWNFAKPRYGALIGVLLVAFIVFAAIGIGLMILGSLIFGLGAYVLAAAPEPLQIVGGIVGFLLFLVLLSLLSVAAFGWLNMVPIIACLEDDKRGLNAMSRATELMTGNWIRLFRIALLLGLATMAIFAFVGGFLALAFGGLNTFKDMSDSSAYGFFASVSGAMAIFSAIWYPAQALIMAVFYLDLRTRKEALDLEWTNYATTAPAPVEAQFQNPPDSYTPTPLEPAPTIPSTLPSSFGAAPIPGETLAPAPYEPVDATPQPEFFAGENKAPSFSPAAADLSFKPEPPQTLESLPDVPTSFVASEVAIPSVTTEPQALPNLLDEFSSALEVTQAAETTSQLIPTPVVVAEAPPAFIEPPVTSSFTSSFAPSSFAPQTAPEPFVSGEPEPTQAAEEPGS